MSEFESVPDEAYFDRNQAVQLLAKYAMQAGHTVGWNDNPDEPSWPILLIDLPEGQVSWHIPQAEVVLTAPPYIGQWDGHTVVEKRRRIVRATL